MTLIEALKQFKGMKENPGNRFDDNTPLGKMLHAAGQKDGEAWCAYLIEGGLVISSPNQETRIRRVMSANVVQCFKNVVADGWIITAYPVPGAIGFMQNYKDGIPLTTGHMTAVDMVNASGSYLSIEGNTNQHGARETNSGQVAQNNRSLGYNPDGLTHLGFARPPW